MTELGSLFIAWLVGALSGFFVSIPVGPINLAIVNEGARKGFWWGFWIGLGAVVMEVVYCAVAFAGLPTCPWPSPCFPGTSLSNRSIDGLMYIRLDVSCVPAWLPTSAALTPWLTTQSSPRPG